MAIRVAASGRATLTVTITGLCLLLGGSGPAQADGPGSQGSFVSPLGGVRPWYALTTNEIQPPADPRQVPTVTRPDFLVTPSAALKESWTDNVFLTSRQQKSDFITTLTPEVKAEANTRKLTAALDYKLSYDQYATYTSLSGLRHDATALLNAKPIEQTLFLDARASISEHPTHPGAAQVAGDRSSPLGNSQMISTSVSPRLSHQFGSIAVAELQVGRDDVQTQAVSTGGSQSSSLSSSLSNTATNRGRIEVRSGSDFSRLLWDLSGQISNQQQSPGSSLDRSSYQLGSEYKLSDDLGLLAVVGQDQIDGMGIDSDKYGGTFYSGGLHWSPSPNLDGRLAFGRRYGQNAIYALIDYKITQRTRLRLSSDSGVGSDATNILDNLDRIQRDQNGEFVDPLTGFAANPAAQDFTYNNSVYRQTRSVATLTHTEDRDTITVGVRMTERYILAQGASTGVTDTSVSTTPGTTNRSVGINASWSHQLSPALSSVLSGSLSRNSGGSSGATKQASGGFGLNCTLNPTLFASFGYNASMSINPGIVTSSSSSSASGLTRGTVVDNTVFVSMRKEF